VTRIDEWPSLLFTAFAIGLAGLLLAPVNVIEGDADRNRDYLAAFAGMVLWAATVYALATLVGVA